MFVFHFNLHWLLPMAQALHEESRAGLLGCHLMAVALFSIVGIIVLGICL